MSAKGDSLCHQKATLDNLGKTEMIRRGAWGLEESKCHPYLQEGLKGRSWKIQVSQPELDLWEDDTTNNPETYFQTYEGQEGYLE